MLTTQQLHESYDELRRLDDAWKMNNKIGKKGETYEISHKLLGLLMTSWAKEVQTGEGKRLEKVFEELKKGNEVIVHDMVIKKPVSRTATKKLAQQQHPVITRSSGHTKIIDVQPKKMPPRDPTTGRFLKKKTSS